MLLVDAPQSHSHSTNPAFQHLASRRPLLLEGLLIKRKGCSLLLINEREACCYKRIKFYLMYSNTFSLLLLCVLLNNQNKKPLAVPSVSFFPICTDSAPQDPCLDNNHPMETTGCIRSHADRIRERTPYSCMPLKEATVCVPLYKSWGTGSHP